MGTKVRGLALVWIVTAVTMAALATPAEATAPWLNSTWHYRTPLEVNSSCTRVAEGDACQSRIDWPVELRINFTSLLDNVGDSINRTFDMDSVRLVEYNNTTENPLVYNISYGDDRKFFVPAQFESCNLLEPWCGYNNTTNANGTVVWLLNGTTPPNTTRYYHAYFDVVENSYPSGTSPKAPMSFPSNLTFLAQGDSFWMNSSRLNISVDTDNRSNLSGIVNVSLDGASHLQTDTGRPWEYTEVINNSTQANHSFDFRNNYTLVVDGPVRKVVQQQGEEVDTANFSNKTFQFRATKRYVYYANNTWVRILVNITNNNTTSLSRASELADAFKCTVFEAVVCPGPIALNRTSNDPYSIWTTPFNTDRQTTLPFRATTLDSGSAFVDRRYLGIVHVGSADFGPTDFSTGGTQRGIGLGLFNKTLAPNTSTVGEGAVSFQIRPNPRLTDGNINRVTIQLRLNFSNSTVVNGVPQNESAPFALRLVNFSLERWIVNQTAEANATTFNRNETVRLAANVTNDSVFNQTSGLRVSNYTLNASGSALLNRTGQILAMAWNTTSGRWELDYTFGDANETGDWNLTARVNDSASLVLNSSVRAFNITNVYRALLSLVEVFYFENVSGGGTVPVVINDSLTTANVTVRNFRNDTGIASVALTDSGLYCDINATTVPTTNRSEAGGGLYQVNFTRNETFAKYWNLSCGAQRNNNTGNVSQVFKTEPPGVNVTIDMTPSANTTSEINETVGNFTFVNITTFNEGDGTAILANVTITAPPGWVVRNSTGAVITGAPVGVTDYHLKNKTYFNLTGVNVSIPPGTMPGSHLINVSVQWTNLNRTFRFNVDNTTITVLSNPVLNVTQGNNTTNPALNLSDATQPIVLGPVAVEHNNVSFTIANFTINATGNDDLLILRFQNNSTAGSDLETRGITLSFNNSTGNASGMNLSKGGAVHIRVNATVPKGHAPGTYWAHYYVNATGSWGSTQCGTYPDRCRKLVNISITVPQNLTWSLSRAMPASIFVFSNNTTTPAGNLTVVHEGNLPLDFTADDVEPGAPWVSNVSQNVTGFSLQPVGQRVVQVNYTILLNQTTGPYTVFVRVNSTTAGSTNLATATNSSNQTLVLQVSDIELPVISNVSFNNDNNTANMSATIVDVLQQSILIGANATDNLGVNQVYANITLPNTTFQNITLARIGSSDRYETAFTPPALNGTYTVLITAFDNNTTANVNNSLVLGTFTFNGSNATNGTLGQSPLTNEATNVTNTTNMTFNLALTFNNIGPGTAFNSSINLTVNNSTALTLNVTSRACGNLSRNSICTGQFLVTVQPGTSNGTYRVDAYLNWTNANGSLNPLVTNNTTISVWRNPLLNLSNETPEVLFRQVAHNATDSVNFTVLSRGNYPLENVTFNQTGVNASGSNLTFAFNDSGFDQSAGTDRSIRLNITVPSNHPVGTWEFRFEANASNSTCVTADRCRKTFNLSVNVTPDRSWTLNDSTAVNTTCGSADNRVQVDVAATELCVVRVNNTGNVDLNFTLGPASQAVNTTTGQGNLSINQTQFVILRAAAARFFNMTLNTTNLTPGIYNFTITVNATDNQTLENGQPLRRNLTVNLTVFTKPLIALVNATTPNQTAPVATNFTEAGRQVLVVEQGQPAVIHVSITDKSLSANTGIREIQANVSRPNGTNYLNISSDCQVNCTVTANNNSTWRVTVPGANLTLRGNHTVNLTALDNLSNPSDVVNVTLRVKPKLVQVMNLSKTSGGTPATDFGPNDNVFWNIYVPDLLGDPVASANATVTFRDPTGDSVSCTTNISTGTTSAAGTVELRCKLNAASTGTYTWNVSLNFTSAANNTTSLNSTAGTLEVKAADLFVTASPGGPWKPGDTMTVTVSTKDQNLQTLGVGAVTVRVEFYYPNSTLYLTNNSPVFLAGPELWSATLALGNDIPFGTVGSPNSTYFAKAVANKTGSNVTVNDSKVVYITDTLTTTLSVGTPQFNNSTMNASFLVFRSGNILVDPDSFSLNVTSASDAPLVGGNCAAPVTVTNISSLPANVQRLGTGFFLVQCQLLAAQPQGFYKANLTVNRKGVTAGDLKAFEMALSSLDVNIDVLAADLSGLSFRATITNPGATGPVDVTVAYEVTVNPTIAAGTQACLIKPFATTTCPTIAVVPPGGGNYNIKVTVSGPGIQTVSINRLVNIAGGAPPPGAPGAPGGAAAGGAAAGPAGPERAILKVEAPRELDAVRGYRLNYTFTVANTGEVHIPALNITLQGVPRSWWSVVSENGSLDLARGQAKRFVLTLLVPPDAERGRLALTLAAEGLGARDAASLLLTIYGDWSELIPDTLRRMNDTLAEVQRRAKQAEAEGVNVSGVLPMLGEAGGLLERAREAYLNRDFAAASHSLDRARAVLDRANTLLVAAPRTEAVPVTPQTVILGIVGVLASAAFGVAVWTGQIARSLSRTARGLVMGAEARPAPLGPPPGGGGGAPLAPPPTPPAGGQAPPPGSAAQPPGASLRDAPAPKVAPPDSLAERMNRARESTERLVKSLQEQMEKGLISKERYEELVRKIRR